MAHKTCTGPLSFPPAFLFAFLNHEAYHWAERKTVWGRWLLCIGLSDQRFLLLTCTAAPQRETGPCSPWSAPAGFGFAASECRSGRADGDFPPPGCPSADSATEHHTQAEVFSSSCICSTSESAALSSFLPVPRTGCWALCSWCPAAEIPSSACWNQPPARCAPAWPHSAGSWAVSDLLSAARCR